MLTHSGDSAVYQWYQRNVVPTLGEGAPQIAADALTGTAVVGGDPAMPRQVTFSGTVAAGSVVKVLIAPVTQSDRLVVVARTVADANGDWLAVSNHLPGGRYRVVAEAWPQRNIPGRLSVVATASLGTIILKA